MSKSSTLEKQDGWYYVDLHVHTPASKDYAGQKTSDEYKKILARACSDASEQDDSDFILPKKKLNLIAITDHNSVDGFKEIMRIKKETIELLQKVKERSPDCELVKSLESEYSTFNSVHVLMGVEVSPDPGIHLLLIFKEDVDPADVETFLDEGFDGNYLAMKGNTEGTLKWNIDQTMDALKSRFDDRAFVVAPHADSNKGLYESLKNLPQPKIRAFRHEALKAVSFNNPDNRDRMMQMLKSPDYQRNSQLSFIQSSDYHGQPNNDIGTLFAKIDFGANKVSFSELYNALSVQKNVVCSVDINKEIYDELIDGFHLTKIVSSSNTKIEISESDYRTIADTGCSYLNTDGGIIEISASNVCFEDRLSASKIYKESLLKILNQKIKPAISDIRIKQVPMSNTKLCILAYIRSSIHLHASDGRIYFLNKSEIKEADTHDIEYIVAKNFEKRIGYANQAHLEQMSLEATRLSRAYSSYPIVIKCDKHIIKGLSSSLDVNFLKLTTTDKINDTLLEDRPNGFSTGSLTCTPDDIQGARLEDGYLRFSSPLWDIDQIDTTSIDKSKEKSLIVVAGGGVFGVDKDIHIIPRKPCALLTLNNPALFNTYLAWFKSSFFIWYNSIILGTDDLLRQVLISKSSIPLPDEMTLPLLEKAGELASEIIEKEYKFLDELNSSVDANKELHNDLVVNFNKEMNDLSLEIDNQVMSALGLTQPEIEEIYEALNSLKIYTYGM